MEKPALFEDLKSINDVEFISWDELRDKTIFLTGATGLIGAMVVKALLFANQERGLNLHLIALVRNEEKAKEKFSDMLYMGILSFVVGKVEDTLKIEEKIDYIIHGASQTASKEFVNQAVETIQIAVDGTKNLLELAKAKDTKGFIYISSMEVYGYPEKGHKVVESEIGSIDPLNPRNSYPISKIMCEAMCCAYAKEYGVPTKIIRLTQTFGPGVNYNDNRIFAYFGKCINKRQNIILKTDGKTERCYIYIADAVTAILTILLKGEIGMAYNAADENTYCSIADMAEMIASYNGIKVEYDIQASVKEAFLETLYMYLDVSALKNLGWEMINGGSSIEKMFERMMSDFSKYQNLESKMEK